MPKRLQTRDPSFEAAFVAFLGEKREASDDVGAAVAAILADVRARGDAALVELSKKFDRVDLDKLGLRVTAAEMRAARHACTAETLSALQVAADRIAENHSRQLPMNERYTDEAGVELGWRWTAVESVGLYVPGGLASYPSSVLMNAIPAKVAGVPRIVMVVPSPNGELNPLVLAAAELAGVEEVYRIGGAQAVRPLANRKQSIAPVFKKLGPGND